MRSGVHCLRTRGTALSRGRLEAAGAARYPPRPRPRARSRPAAARGPGGRVGKFYECVGFDAVLLVEYAGLNPMAPEKGVPRAGCPEANLRRTLAMLIEPALTVVGGGGWRACLCVVFMGVGGWGGGGGYDRVTLGSMSMHAWPGITHNALARVAVALPVVRPTRHA